jgi:hypothetical protein
MIKQGLLLVSAITLVGCASMVVKEEDMVKKTESALGLNRSEFTISNREDNSMQTDYVVTTKSGRKYNCYVTGSVWQLGSAISDAICSELGKSAGTANSNTQCNALLKKAGKC